VKILDKSKMRFPFLPNLCSFKSLLRFRQNLRAITNLEVYSSGVQWSTDYMCFNSWLC